MSIDLVISAYRDPLDWVLPLQRPGVRVFLYDKWEHVGNSRPYDVLSRDGLTVERLPNVGKLDHSFMHHIVEHWNDLADWTVFAPDSAPDHLRGACMEDALVPADSLRVPWVWRGRDWGPDGRLNWKAFAAIPDRNGTNWYERYQSGTITPAKLGFVEWSKRYIGYDPNGPDYPGYMAGIYGVPRRAIQYLPVEFYARLRDQVAHSREPEEGHYLERSYIVMWGGQARSIKDL